MVDLFSSLTPLPVFLGLAAIGFFFLLITFILGDFLEGDADFDHDVDTEHGFGEHESGGPSFFSSRVISVFVAAFGGFGAIATFSGMAVLPSSLVGLVGGLALGWLVYVFARFLYSQQATSEITLHDLLGQSAKVTICIPRGGLGQVRCIVGESQIEKVARSVDGNEISYNELVRIESIEADAVVVRKTQAHERGPSVHRLFEDA